MVHNRHVTARVTDAVSSATDGIPSNKEYKLYNSMANAANEPNENGQQEILIQMKKSLGDDLPPMYDDALLLRFLKARDFDLEKAVNLVRENILWRKNMETDTLSDWEIPEVLQKYFGGGLLGCDQDGRPVYFDPYGKRDIKGIMHSITGREIMKLHLKQNELFEKIIKENSKKRDKPVHGVIMIYDMCGMEEQAFWKPGMEFGKQVLNTLQMHYPELMYKMILINCPKISGILYAAVKPFIPEKSRQKIIHLGTNYKDQLLKYIPAEILPVTYGGKCEDKSKVLPPEKVPKSYYLSGRQVSSRNLVEKVLDRGVSLEFQYEITRPGSLLYYEFKTKERDIGFGVKMLNTDGSRTPVLEKRRYHCYLGVPENGQVLLDQPGTYIVKFDNSFSIVRSKSLSYWVEVLEPLSEEEDIAFREPEKDPSLFD